MKPLAKKLREIRNKHFPPKLEFGALLQGYDMETKEKREIIFDEWLMSYSIEEKPHILARSEGEFINFQTEKNLGKPVSLEEILRMIKNKYGVDNFSEKLFTDIPELLRIIDLTRSLEEQDDEVLEELIKLVKRT